MTRQFFLVLGQDAAGYMLAGQNAILKRSVYIITSRRFNKVWDASCYSEFMGGNKLTVKSINCYLNQFFVQWLKWREPRFKPWVLFYWPDICVHMIFWRKILSTGKNFLKFLKLGLGHKLGVLGIKFFLLCVFEW